MANNNSKKNYCEQGKCTAHSFDNCVYFATISHFQGECIFYSHSSGNCLRPEKIKKTEEADKK